MNEPLILVTTSYERTFESIELFLVPVYLQSIKLFLYHLPYLAERKLYHAPYLRLR